MSIEQHLPDRTAFLVEYPGYVRNVQAAVDTLGGIGAVTTTANSDSSVLQLRFRPDDPYSHPLYAERQSAKGLLLKIARKVADPSEASVKAEVLACVHSKFTFSGMADYCVTASSKVKQLPWIIPYTAAAVPQVAADQGGSASLGDHCIHNVAILTSQSECLHVRWCDDRQHVCSLWNL